MALRREFLTYCGAAVPALAGLAAVQAQEPAAEAGAAGWGLLPRPEDFGAAGDGAANDTAAVQRAAEAGPGGMCLTPGRTYLIDRLVIPNRPWRLEGFGATLKKRDDGENYALVVTENHVQNVASAGQPIEIHALRLDGGRVGNECVGILFQTWNSRLFNLGVVNMSGDGVRMSGITHDGTPLKSTLVNNWIEGVDIRGSGGHGVHIHDVAGNKCTDWYLAGGWISGSAGWAVHAREMAGAQVGPRLHTYGNQGGGLYANRFSVGSLVQGVLFEAGDTCAIPGGWRSGMLAHCYFMGDARLEIGFASPGTGVFKRVVVDGCNFSGKSHILHRGDARHTIEAVGCLFDTPDPFRKEKDGAFFATRCWADNQERLMDGAF
jgi:hypothetical protein